jgi:hypothetical protein
VFHELKSGGNGCPYFWIALASDANVVVFVVVFVVAFAFVLRGEASAVVERVPVRASVPVMQRQGQQQQQEQTLGKVFLPGKVSLPVGSSTRTTLTLCAPREGKEYLLAAVSPVSRRQPKATSFLRAAMIVGLDNPVSLIRVRLDSHAS